MQPSRNLLTATATMLADVFTRSPTRVFGAARRARLVLAAAVVVAAFVPAALATPITYDFTVSDLTGALAGDTYHGTFSYDSTIVVPGNFVEGANLLTALDFTFSGINYGASMANTGWLGWDGAGNLEYFTFGTNCSNGGCGVDLDTDPNHRTWFLGSDSFAYGRGSDQVFGNMGKVDYARTDVSVPEPGTLGLFGFGLLLLGMAGWRRVSGGRTLGAMP